jgi:phospholipase C
MTPSGRRQFLSGTAKAAAAAVAGTFSLFPPWLRSALAVEPSSVTGTLQDVAHIVVLTQENRSFDHYFGTLRGVRGFADRFPVPVEGGRSVWQQPRVLPSSPPGPLQPFHLNTERDFALMRAEGTPHSWPDAQQAWDQGRMGQWTSAKGEHAMGHYTRADLPFHCALADAFTVCDAYHASFQGGTNTNRLFLMTGTNDPLGLAGGPASYNDLDSLQSKPEFGHYSWTSYAERLQAAGIRWQVYQDMADNYDDNPLVGFKPFRDAAAGVAGSATALRERALSTRSLSQLRADVQANALPQVSWIVATAAGSEHPERSSPAQGADYTAQVLAALTSNPEVWSRTVLILNYDENDGFFDHVPPPAAPSCIAWHADAAQARWAGASTVDTRGEYHEHLVSYHNSRCWCYRPGAAAAGSIPRCLTTLR